MSKTQYTLKRLANNYIKMTFKGLCVGLIALV